MLLDGVGIEMTRGGAQCRMSSLGCKTIIVNRFRVFWNTKSSAFFHEVRNASSLFVLLGETKSLRFIRHLEM
jgi:hypothetical protein